VDINDAYLPQLLTPKLTKYIPHTPTPKQIVFLLSNHIREVFYGGAAGGGKSDVMLMAALQFVDVPGYSAIIFRKTYADLSLPGALISRSKEWLSNTDAKWIEREKTWVFPSGATLAFGYLENDNDKYRYQSAEFQFIGFDELTQFSEPQYLYLFSRLRRVKGLDVPLRIRSASNPGGAGHEWVKARFIRPSHNLLKENKLFISAFISDNPYLSAEEYKSSLDQLDTVTRDQLLSGDWDISAKGKTFDREWFTIVEDETAIPTEFTKVVRSWDLAATEPKPGKRPDYTVGVLLGKTENDTYYILDLVRFQKTPGDVETRIRQVAEVDGKGVQVIIERDPGAAGLAVSDHYTRTVLLGYDVKTPRTTGSKETRAVNASSYSQAGKVYIKKGYWNGAFLRELERFPYGAHDDQVDAFSTAMNSLITPNVVEVIDNPFYN
jgi:predicted phage terminase large subunit-like protein